MYQRSSIKHNCKFLQSNSFLLRGSKQCDPKKEVNCKIRLWANGFQINDGEFRDLAQDINKNFMQELKSG